MKTIIDNMPTLPPPPEGFEMQETTLKVGRGYRGNLSLRLCNADFVYLADRGFKASLCTKDVKMSHSGKVIEMMSTRIARIISAQDGVCDCVMANLKAGAANRVAKIHILQAYAKDGKVFFKCERA